MTDKEAIIRAVIFVFMYAVALTIFVFWYLYTVKVHVRKIYGKTAKLHNELRDTQAIAAETQEELYLVKMKTTRNYI